MYKVHKLWGLFRDTFHIAILITKPEERNQTDECFGKYTTKATWCLTMECSVSHKMTDISKY